MKYVLVDLEYISKNNDTRKYCHISFPILLKISNFVANDDTRLEVLNRYKPKAGFSIFHPVFDTEDDILQFVSLLNEVFGRIRYDYKKI